jgi:hypothetical protein
VCRGSDSRICSMPRCRVSILSQKPILFFFKKRSIILQAALLIHGRRTSDPMYTAEVVDSIAVIRRLVRAHSATASAQPFRPLRFHEPAKGRHRWRWPLFVLRCLSSPLPCTPDEHSATPGTRLRPIVVALRTRPIRCCARSPRSQGST